MKSSLAVVVVVLAGCTDFGLGAPTGGESPVDAGQTIANGASLGLSADGLAKIFEVAEARIAERLTTKGCIGPQGGGSFSACTGDDGTCSPGCEVDYVPTGVSVAMTGPTTIDVDVRLSLSTRIATIAGGIPCAINVSVDEIRFRGNATLSVIGDELVAPFAVTTVTFGEATYTGCGAGVAAFVDQFLEGSVSNPLADAVAGAVGSATASLLAVPQNVNGTFDITALLTGSSTGTSAATHIGPSAPTTLNGGFATAVATGFSTAVNACTSGLTAPATPASVTLDGSATSDMSVTLSKEALDLFGYNVVASGGLCVAADTTRDLIDDVLGVALSGQAADVELRVTPLRPLTFTVAADGTVTGRLSARVEASGIATVTATVVLPFVPSPRGSTIELLRDGVRAEDVAVENAQARYQGVDTSKLGLLVTHAFSALGSGAMPVTGPRDVSATTVTERGGALVLGGVFGSPVSVAPPSAPTVVATTDAGAVTLSFSDGLEHSWRSAGSAWHPYVAGDTLVLSDPDLAWPGTKSLEVRSRVAGSDAAVSAATSATVGVDYRAPTILALQRDGTRLVVNARDAVSSALEYAVTDGGAPLTWAASSTLDTPPATGTVYVRDSAGLVASQSYDFSVLPDAPASGDDDDGCAAIDTAGFGMLASLLVLMGRRRRS